eukprot:GEMP01034981.1.p1 GENE.GEMP01034981.1~~GEMP01034981.1.p1  ORF type:complete len:285 (+),score=53.63 GEMP01034981.1:115-969(+)
MSPKQTILTYYMNYWDYLDHAKLPMDSSGNERVHVCGFLSSERRASHQATAHAGHGSKGRRIGFDFVDVRHPDVVVVPLATCVDDTNKAHDHSAPMVGKYRVNVPELETFSCDFFSSLFPHDYSDQGNDRTAVPKVADKKRRWQPKKDASCPSNSSDAVDASMTEQANKVSTPKTSISTDGLPHQADKVPDNAHKLVIIDEIGKMELFSKEFCAGIRRIMRHHQDAPHNGKTGKTVYVCSIAKKGSGFLDDVRRAGTRLVEVSSGNRDELAHHLIKDIETIFRT